MIELLLSFVALACAVIIPVWWNRRWEHKVDGLKDSARELLDETLDQLKDYYTTEKTLLVQSLPQIAEMVGDNLFGRIRGMIGGQASGDVRLEKGLHRAISEDVLNESNPLLGAVLDKFPTAKKFITEHPEAIPMLLQYVQQLGGGQAPRQVPTYSDKTRYKY